MNERRWKCGSMGGSENGWEGLLGWGIDGRGVGSMGYWMDGRND